MQTDLVLVVDYGAQYAQLIARRVREAHVYSEIVPHTMPVAELLARRPSAIILSGGPASVYADGAPAVDPALFEAGVPVFGICYGFQAMVARARRRRRAHRRQRVRTDGADRVDARLPAARPAGRPAGLDEPRRRGHRSRRPGSPCWRRHRARRSPRSRISSRRLAGVQFHPEVLHTEHGQAILAAVPDRDRRAAPVLDRSEHHRRAGRGDPGAGRRQAGRSAGCRAASTRRSRRRSCSARSAIS